MGPPANDRFLAVIFNQWGSDSRVGTYALDPSRMDIGRLWDNWHSFLGRLERSWGTPEINIKELSRGGCSAVR